MNEAFFGAKRVFQGGLRLLRKHFAAVAPGLTSARFDMMFALCTPRRRRSVKRVPWERSQKSLRGVLGVSGPVVSRMLRSLERLGWVSRRIDEDCDRRRRWVTLTPAGIQVVEEAYRRLFVRVRRFVFRAICFGDHRDYFKRITHMDTLESYQRGLRKKCRDRASLYYEWGAPDS